jgi:predicted acylesterase/phospholipase RssA
MLALEQIEDSSGRHALDACDYLTAVSGGALAGGGYLAALRDHTLSADADASFHLASAWHEHLAPSLSIRYGFPMLRSMFSPRIWFSPLNRGDRLEYDLAEHLFGYPSGSPTLRDCFIPATDTTTPVSLPMLFCTAALYNSVHQMSFTPDLLDTMQVTGYTHRMKQVEVDTAAALFDMPFSVAVKASASFPVVVPPTLLRCTVGGRKAYLPVWDGGMVDNISYQTAVWVLAQDTAARRVLLVSDADQIALRSLYRRRRSGLGLAALVRVPVGGLDSHRSQRYSEIATYCRAYDIQPVYLGYDRLLDSAACAVTLPRWRRQAAYTYLLNRMSDTDAPLSPEDRRLLFEVLADVRTRFGIWPQERELLILTARYIVREQEATLRKVLFGE